MNPIHDLSPEEAAHLEALQRMAEAIDPQPGFQAHLESELKRSHRPPSRFRSTAREALQLAGLAVAMALLAVLLSWLFRSLAPMRVPAGNGTSTPAQGTGTPLATLTSQQNGETYDWHGTTLTINARIPDGPSEAAVFLARPEDPVTLEMIQQLATQFGIQGEVYEMQGELPGMKSYLITDGQQRLEVRSDLYYAYYPDYAAWQSDGSTLQITDPEGQVADFLSRYGFDSAFQLEPATLFGAYYALFPADDGVPFRHDYFTAGGMLFSFGRDGISRVQATLQKREQVGIYALRSAQEALEILLSPEIPPAGVLEDANFSNGAYAAWYRSYPYDRPITLRGWLYVYPPVTGNEPLVMIDRRIITGDTSGMQGFTEPRFIEAEGQLHSENGTEVFKMASWRINADADMGLMGTLQQQGDQVVLVTMEGQTVIMPDAPAGITLPLENVYALGTLVGEVYEWSSFDLRMGAGGGGGGGGAGLYSLNLSGTPVPFPTSSPTPLPIQYEGRLAQYMVKEGDTLISIAGKFGTTTDVLMQLNSLGDPEMISIGQPLLVPSSSPEVIDGKRGLLTVMIFKHTDGTEEKRYSFVGESYGGYYLLEGNVQGLETYQNRPIIVWGTAQISEAAGDSILTVERFKPVHPEVDFRIALATVQSQIIDGQPVNLLTLEDGKTYAALYADGMPNGDPMGADGTQIQAEVLVLPDETLGGYPALRLFGSSTVDNPKNGQPFELTVTADQVHVFDASEPGREQEMPTATIEKIELVYFSRDPRFKVQDPSAGPAYIQPMWRFYGHYSTGGEFEVMIQALRQEYLSPEIQLLDGPG